MGRKGVSQQRSGGVSGQDGDGGRSDDDGTVDAAEDGDEGGC